MAVIITNSGGPSLMHYRVGGEKKGVRRWQNEDRTLTSAGKEHYAEMYGWGKKDGNKKAESSDPAKLKDTQKVEVDHNAVRKALATDAVANDKSAGRAGKISAKLAAGSAAISGLVGGLSEVSKILNYNLGMINQKVFVENSDAIISKAVQKLVNYGDLNRFGNSIESFSRSKLLGDIGGAAIYGLAAGAITAAGVAAYYKIRSSLGKRKIAKDVIDELDVNIKHSDDEITFEDVLDSLDDKQKYAVIYLIDQILKSRKS